MLKEWKKLTIYDKKSEVPKIAELRGIGYTWEDIGTFYGVSGETIRDYYKNHKLPKNEELAKSIIIGAEMPVKNEITPNRKAEIIAILTSLFVQLILVIATFLCVIDFAIYKQSISLGLMTLSVILIWINYTLELKILDKTNIGDKI